MCMIHDKYDFRLCDYRCKMVCPCAFHNDEYQRVEQSPTGTMYTIDHCMTYNWRMCHDMEDIEKDSLIDKSRMNKWQHIDDVLDRAMNLFDRMIDIDQL
jgi:hypothetical protein